MLLPTGTGQPRPVDVKLERYHQATFLPDGHRIVIAGNEAGQGTRLYDVDLAAATQRAISAPGIVPTVQAFPVSPDKQWIAGLSSDGRLHLYPLDGGRAQPIPGAPPGLVPIRWSADGKHLFAVRLDSVPAHVQKIDPRSGAAATWATIAPTDPAGIHGFPAVLLAADGRSLAYSYARFLSEMYLVTGAR
jgi:hypothetical protein